MWLRQAGVGLVEVMVTLVVLSIGLLGVSALLNYSLQFNQDAYLKTYAASLMNDISERMRVNPTQLYFVDFNETAPEQQNRLCENQVCSSFQLREYDIQQWKFNLSELLPQGNGKIEIIQNLATITVIWQSSEHSEKMTTLSSKVLLP